MRKVQGVMHEQEKLENITHDNDLMLCKPEEATDAEYFT